ncbi:MAG: LLM class flavin-dependent oxidoreductase [Balneolaceae bacterium]|nr:LLM class flavin-dependent oxidoreductase [Balneolaceae bacterium]
MKAELFTTMPESIKSDRVQFIRELKRIAVQSEKYGYKGTLIYSDNRLADPWVVTGLILDETTQLIPMVALQPVYMHPYAVAKKISSIAFIHKRKIALNLVAGGYINDLIALGGSVDHDRRYDRLVEYTEIIQKLLTTSEGVTYEGEFYQIKNLKLHPEMPEELLPDYYLSGSSEAAKVASARLGVQLIQYPVPAEELSENGNASIQGIRIGVLARHNHEKAWEEAHQRFPATRIGELSHQLAKKTSDSEWHKKLSHQNGNGKTKHSEPVYWLGPFEYYHTFCPYLVGSYDEVAKAISKYLQAGCKTCIIDTPVSDIELHSTMQVFNRAQIHLEKEGQL